VEVLVQALAGVFFQVGAHQAHGLLLVAEEEARCSPPCTTGISYWLIW
jgi:hypothetical protein